MGKLVTDLLIGFCLGMANIIPGVSGGTFLLIFQIYERVFAAISCINKTSILYAGQLLFNLLFQSGKQRHWKQLTGFLMETDFFFLLKLVAGAGCAVVILSRLMKYLMEVHFSSTYALFFGLILVSILIPVKMLKNRRLILLVPLVIGAGLTIYVTWAVNPYDKVERKSAMYQQQYEDEAGHRISSDQDSPARAFEVSGKYAIQEYGYIFFCGAVAVSAMVLPGISGSLVLILMGEYFAVISAISGLTALKLDDIAFLCSFSVGLVIGGIFFARLLHAVLKKWYDVTMAFLIGLMAGSLYALWPFKKYIVMAEQYVPSDAGIAVIENVRVYTNVNVLPDPGQGLFPAVFFFAAGCVIMSFFIRTEASGKSA